MKVLNQKKRIIKVRKSQLLLFGSFLVFIGVVCLSWNHLLLLKEQVFEDVRLKLFEGGFEGTSEEIVTPNVENIEGEVPPAPSGGGSTSSQTKPNHSFSYNYIGYLEIPKIRLKKGFVAKESKYNNISYNVTVSERANYPDEEKGNFILMAHSGDSYISYFAYLYRLQLGDIAKVTYNNQQYKYRLVKIEEQPKVGVVAIHRDNYNVRALTLITCTKDNDYTQTIYIFELV